MGTTAPADVAAFFDRYAAALAGGDLPAIAACYALPALVVGDAGAIPVAEAGQVEAAFAGAADAYRAQGLVSVRPELSGVDQLTRDLVEVAVRWAYLDEAGDARQHTSYRYLLRRAGGRLGIQVVVETAPPP